MGGRLRIFAAPGAEAPGKGAAACDTEDHRGERTASAVRCGRTSPPCPLVRSAQAAELQRHCFTAARDRRRPPPPSLLLLPRAHTPSGAANWRTFVRRTWCGVPGVVCRWAG